MTRRATILYFPHGGGPLPLLDEPRHAEMNAFLHGFPESLDRPDAIVVVSAHWEETRVSVTAARSPPMIFDYYGFPAETYEYSYPAPGHPELASRLHRLFSEAGVESRLDVERGFDHGLFVPLMLMYPAADIPCIQVSLHASLDAAQHIRIGRALAALGDENLLILGSGFSFHNLRELMSKRGEDVDPRNQAFEDWLAQTLTDGDLEESERERRLADWIEAPEARFCHPREEHLLPLHVCYGIAGRAAVRAFRKPVLGFLASAYRWD
jgi:aromatic ring-opening dioxygenase catalytic subunit (LigB family)